LIVQFLPEVHLLSIRNPKFHPNLFSPKNRILFWVRFPKDAQQFYFRLRYKKSKHWIWEYQWFFLRLSPGFLKLKSDNHPVGLLSTHQKKPADWLWNWPSCDGFRRRRLFLVW